MPLPLATYPLASLDWLSDFMSGYRTYEVVFLGSMLVAIVATAAVIRLARATRLVDQPGVRKIHAAAIPRIGGAAIVFAVLALVLPVLALDNTIGQAFRQSQTQIITILASGLFMFAVGLIDDIRDMGARAKVLALVAASAAVCAAGVRIDSIIVGDWFSLSLGWLGWPVTIVWIVGITTGVNFIDGLDGLAAGISVITCGVIAVFAFHVGLPVTTVLMLAMLGSLIGFLFLNFNPARIFMGDCGSMFLGFVISAASVHCANRSETVVGLALPFLALGVPIFDVFFTILRRSLLRRDLFASDWGHIHHRLLERGLQQRQVAIIIYAVTLIAAGLGLFMIFVRGAGTAVIFLLVSLLLLLVFRAAGAVRLREMIVVVRRNRAIARDAKKEQKVFDHAQLTMREARSLEGWWAAICQACRKLEFVRISLDLTNRDGTRRTLLWRRAGPEPPAHEKLSVTLSVADRREGRPLKTEADVYLNGSVESAGRRVALFGRLLDEYSIASLPRQPREATATEAHGPTASPSQYPPEPADNRGPASHDATQHNPV